MYDVIVIGGSYAGMAAALILARGRRKVAVLDAGQRRNRFAAASHGLLGQDGRSPGAIADDARKQLLKYPSVTWRNGTAVSAERTGEHFSVRMEDGEVLSAKRLILATGVVDELPDVPGLAERWGKSVFHCPYCHGYELGNGPLGVLAVGEVSMHHGMLIPEWGRSTMFLNGAFEPDEEQMSQLLARGVSIERERVEEVTGKALVKLADGRTIELAGLFVASRTTPSSPLAGMLGCELTESPLGIYISTNDMKETSVPGVFACGDAARAAGNVTFAISDGALAGLSAHRSLIFGHA